MTFFPLQMTDRMVEDSERWRPCDGGGVFSLQLCLGHLNLQERNRKRNIRVLQLSKMDFHIIIICKRERDRAGIAWDETVWTLIFGLYEAFAQCWGDFRLTDLTLGSKHHQNYSRVKALRKSVWAEWKTGNWKTHSSFQKCINHWHTSTDCRFLSEITTIQLLHHTVTLCSPGIHNISVSYQTLII